MRVLGVLKTEARNRLLNRGNLVISKLWEIVKLVGRETNCIDYALRASTLLNYLN